MTTAGNERYLHYILLLGEGSLLILKGLVNREVQNSGQTFSFLLLKNSKRLRQQIKIDKQYELLYPPAGNVNTNLDTYDISLLTLIILTLFGPNLTQEERNAVRIIRTFRNTVFGHTTSLSFEEEEYNMHRDDLSAELLKLASGLDDHIRDKCQEIIKRSASGSLEAKSVLQELKSMHEFDVKTLSNIETSLNAAHEKLDVLCREKSCDEGEVPLSPISPEFKEMQKDTKETKAMTIESLTEIKEVKELLKTLNARLGTSSASDVEQDVDTKMRVTGDTEERVKHAEENIVQNINNLLKEIDTKDDFQGVDEEQLRYKVRNLLHDKQGSDYEVCVALLDLLLDIVRQPETHLVSAAMSCVVLKIRCSSIRGLLALLQYLESDIFCQRLAKISETISISMGMRVSISAQVTRESFENIYKRFGNDSAKSYSRLIKMPIRCRSLDSLSHIWNMFGENGTNYHFDRISEAVTNVVGAKIEVTPSINKKLFKEQLSTALRGIKSEPNEKMPVLTSKDDSGKESGNTVSPNAVPTNNERELDAPPDIHLRQIYKVTHTTRSKIQLKDDHAKCHVTCCCVLSNNEILLGDGPNKRLKKLNNSYELSSFCSLESYPSAVCYLGNDEAVVCLSRKVMHFVDVSDDVKLTRRVKLEHICTGIVADYASIYITDDCTLYCYRCDLTKDRTIYKDAGSNFHSLAVNKTEETILFICCDKTLITIDRRGQIIHRLTGSDFSDPKGFCFAESGTLFLGCLSPNRVLCIDVNENRVIGTVLDELKLIRSLCFDTEKSALIVGAYDNFITVYEIERIDQST